MTTADDIFDESFDNISHQVRQDDVKAFEPIPLPAADEELPL